MTEDRLEMVKFRAESILGGDYVYGFYKRNRHGDHYIELDDNATVVKPETVVPLVGYDRNGNEVYEDDWLFDDEEECYWHVCWDETDRVDALESDDRAYGLTIDSVATMTLASPRWRGGEDDKD